LVEIKIYHKFRNVNFAFMLEHLYLFVLLVFVGIYLLSKFDLKRLWKIKKKKKRKKISRTRLGGQLAVRPNQTLTQTLTAGQSFPYLTWFFFPEAQQPRGPCVAWQAHHSPTTSTAPPVSRLLLPLPFFSTVTEQETSPSPIPRDLLAIFVRQAPIKPLRHHRDPLCCFSCAREP